MLDSPQESRTCIMYKLLRDVAPNRAKEVVLQNLMEVENVRSWGSGPGPDHQLVFADQYLKWVEGAEFMQRHLWEGDEWLADLQTARWRDISRLDSSTRRPIALINGEIDHQALRLRTLAAVLDQPEQTPGSPPPPPSLYKHSLLDLHPEVVSASQSLFETGHYAEAIFAACKIIELAVQRRSGIDRTGVALMDRAFGTTEPRLIMSRETGQTKIDEQEGIRFLFRGVTQGVRNPKAHGAVEQTDPARTFEYLALASLLMHRLDQGVRQPDPTAEAKATT